MTEQANDQAELYVLRKQMQHIARQILHAQWAASAVLQKIIQIDPANKLMDDVSKIIEGLIAIDWSSLDEEPDQ